MLRTILITLLNIALPFIIRAAYLYALKMIYKHKVKKGMKDITPPQWHFPVVKLIIIGLIFAIISVGIGRVFFTETHTPYIGNITKGEIIP